jgi:hypothetical protein
MEHACSQSDCCAEVQTNSAPFERSANELLEMIVRTVVANVRSSVRSRIQGLSTHFCCAGFRLQRHHLAGQHQRRHRAATWGPG